MQVTSDLIITVVRDLLKSFRYFVFQPTRDKGFINFMDKGYLLSATAIFEFAIESSIVEWSAAELCSERQVIVSWNFD